MSRTFFGLHVFIMVGHSRHQIVSLSPMVLIVGGLFLLRDKYEHAIDDR
jgi:hypothetical protein